MSVCVCREYPCDQVSMLNVTLLYVGNASSQSLRNTAVHLLHLLYKRFFMDDFVLLAPPTSSSSSRPGDNKNESVFSYLHTLTMCLPAFACCMLLSPQLINVYLSRHGPTAANLQQWVCSVPMLGQTDGWTPYHFIDPALHTV